jgi:5'-deoxy-5'-methylthioadenosine phosphorylase
VTIGIIAGTGFDTLAELQLHSESHGTTPWGKASAPIQIGTLHGADVLFLSRHGHGHGLAPHEINYRANLAALRDAGASALLAVYTVGGITQDVIRPGTLAVPDQIIDYTWGREHTFSQPGDVLHVDFTEPFDAELRAQLVRAARAEGGEGAPPVVDGGVYGAVQGPRLETAAEIDRMERDGCNLVGMTGMPEVSLARELGMRIAGIGLVVNPAAGRGVISMEEIRSTAAQGRARILAALARVVSGTA